MEYSVEELKNALIERCEKEGILYATVAISVDSATAVSVLSLFLS